MKTKKMNPKNKRLSSGLRKPNKRSIHVKGKWKAIELDPSLFSEEGMEGLVCFEELTNYRLIDSEKVAATTAKELKKEKKKPKKRKVSEVELEGGEKADVESKEEGNTTEPAEKKAKKKKKKNKKLAAKESVQPDNTSAEGASVVEKGGEDETANEDTLKDSSAIISDAQSKLVKKKNKKKKKKQKQQIEKDTIPVKQPDTESPFECQVLEKDKSSQDKVTKPSKKQVKNWTNAALSGSDDKNADVSAWKDLFVPPTVLKALSSLGFGSPTPIQALTLPPAIRDRMDILGAAETGKNKLCPGLVQ